jgi:hypothetical protein
MTPDDMTMVGSRFAVLATLRRQLDASDDDQQRQDIDVRWLQCAHEIAGLQASGWAALKTKARAMLMLLDASADAAAWLVAQSLARDVIRH